MKRAWLTLFVLCSACADEEGAADTPIEDLTAANFRALCRWSVEHEFAARSVEQFCTVDAVETATSQAECEAFRGECIGEEQPYWMADHEAELAACDALDELDVPSGCTASLAHVMKCFADLDDALSADARSASCEQPGRTFDQSEPPSCTRLASSCPWIRDAARTGL